jgi:hypothetical protein
MKCSCAYCGKVKAPKKCASCMLRWYCDHVCQKSHWKESHKKECRTLQATALQAENTQAGTAGCGSKNSSSSSSSSSIGGGGDAGGGSASATDPPQPHPNTEPLGPGVDVKLSGLTSPASLALNGTHGVAGVQDLTSGRWTIYLHTANDRMISAKSCNIVVLPLPPRSSPHLECGICLEDDEFVMPTGCGCRGEAAGKHLACIIQHADVKSAQIIPGQGDAEDDETGQYMHEMGPYMHCPTCLQQYTGRIDCGLARHIYLKASGQHAARWTKGSMQRNRAVGATHCLVGALQRAGHDRIAIVMYKYLIKLEGRKGELCMFSVNLAGALSNIGDLNGAMKLWSDALELSIKENGRAHETTINLLHNLGNTCMSLNQHTKARPSLLPDTSN